MFRPLRQGVQGLSPPGCLESVSRLTPDTELRQCTLTLDSLPEHLNGLRLLLLTDLHCNSRQGVNRLRRCVDVAASRSPDLALVLGDFGEKADLLPSAVATVASLHARLGTFCVRGNHDFEHGRARLLAGLLADTPIQLLDDRVWTGNGLCLIGTEAPWGSGAIPDIPRDGFRIALSHTPDNFFALQRGGADLVVAGHTHGGWLRIPHLGPVLVASRYGALLALGAFRLRQAVLYVAPAFRHYPCAPWRGGEVTELILCCSG
jgi:predicted MPP superfamily phosphohydrolase